MPLNPLTISLAFTCAPPAILGLVKYKNTDAAFHPFIWAMCLSLFTESAHTLLNLNSGPWPCYYFFANLYPVLNLIFYLLFFYRQKIISPTGLQILLTIGAIAFIINCFFRHPLHSFMLEKSVLYNLFIFLIAGSLLSNQIFSTQKSLVGNPVFFICCGASLFCSIFILVNVLFLFQGKTGFNSFLFGIMRYINAVAYILFLWAIIIMPKQKQTPVYAFNVNQNA